MVPFPNKRSKELLFQECLLGKGKTSKVTSIDSSAPNKLGINYAPPVVGGNGAWSERAGEKIKTRIDVFLIVEVH